VLAPPPIRGLGAVCAATPTWQRGVSFPLRRTLMTDRGVPGDIIRLNSVTESCQAGMPPAQADVSTDVAAGKVVAVMDPRAAGRPSCSTS
jgi:hypothetical protein